MKIEHLALWTTDLEATKAFYIQYFGAKSHEKYRNPTTLFESYFLSFDTGARLEIMQKPHIPANQNDVYTQHIGLNHLAFSVGSPEAVDTLTEQLRADGFEIIGEPRTTGDGYYESVVLDNEKNRIEITA
jgi:lactoylglutathione lyase